MKWFHQWTKGNKQTTIDTKKVDKSEVNSDHDEMHLKNRSDLSVVDIGRLTEKGATETLTGYCTLSENLEPCEWALSKQEKDGQKPKMRILF